MPLRQAVEKWWVKVIITALITMFVGWVFSWAGDMSKRTAALETATAVTQTNIEVTKESILEIKDTQRRMEDKLDRVLDRELQRATTPTRPEIYGREDHDFAR